MPFDNCQLENKDITYTTNKSSVIFPVFVRIRQWSFVFFTLCLFSMNQRKLKCEHQTDAACPPDASLSDLDMTDCSPLTLNTLFAFPHFTQPINQTGARDGCHCVRNTFFCPGLNRTGRQKASQVWNTERKTEG